MDGVQAADEAIAMRTTPKSVAAASIWDNVVRDTEDTEQDVQSGTATKIARAPKWKSSYETTPTNRLAAHPWS